MLFFVTTAPVSAITYYLSGDDSTYCNGIDPCDPISGECFGTVTANKATYSPGETITLSHETSARVSGNPANPSGQSTCTAYVIADGGGNPAYDFAGQYDPYGTISGTYVGTPSIYNNGASSVVSDGGSTITTYASPTMTGPAGVGAHTVRLGFVMVLDNSGVPSGSTPHFYFSDQNIDFSTSNPATVNLHF